MDFSPLFPSISYPKKPEIGLKVKRDNKTSMFLGTDNKFQTFLELDGNCYQPTEYVFENTFGCNYIRLDQEFFLPFSRHRMDEKYFLSHHTFSEILK